MPLEDFIINVYLLVDGYFKQAICNRRLRKCGENPKLTDQEVITIEIVGEYLGLGHDKRIWQYFKAHWMPWFPNLGCRTSFTRQSANLHHIKLRIYELLSAEASKDRDLYLFDGFPIPVCHIKRYKRSKNKLISEGSVGYCAAKDEHYFGFKGHIMITMDGVAKSYEIAQANIDEREILKELSRAAPGDVIADKGLLGIEFKDELQKLGSNLHTPLRSNMQETRPEQFLSQLMNIRRKVETVIGQLVDRFNIQSIKAKDLWHLMVKASRKILAHTVCFIINKNITSPDQPLKLDLILT
jgi:hypothetical protein